MATVYLSKQKENGTQPEILTEQNPTVYLKGNPQKERFLDSSYQQQKNMVAKSQEAFFDSPEKKRKEWVEKLNAENAKQREARDRFGSAISGFDYGLERFGSGVLGAVEGTVDALAAPVTYGLGKLTSSNLLEPITGQHQEENPVSKFFTGWSDSLLSGGPTQMWNESIEKRYNPTQAQRFIGDINAAIGGMAPAIASGTLAKNIANTGITAVSKAAQQFGPAITQGVFGLGAGGQAANEAKQSGATTEQALLYGAASGTLETAIEGIAGGIPNLPKGMVGDIAKKISSSPVAPQLADMLGEGGEEALSTIITPYLQRAIYDPNAKTATADEIVQSALMGMVVSGALNAPSNISQYAAERRYNQQKDAILSQAMQAPNGSTARTLAEQYSKRGGPLSDLEAGGLVVALGEIGNLPQNTLRNPAEQLLRFNKFVKDQNVQPGTELSSPSVALDNPSIDAVKTNGYNQGGGVNDGGEEVYYTGGRLGNTQNDSQGQAADGAGYRERTQNVRNESGNYRRESQQIFVEDHRGNKITPEISERITGTKITDDTGRPIAVEHFTPNMEFETFGEGDTGFHFGSHTQAEGRAIQKGGKGRTIRAYLNIQSPIRVSSDIMNWKASATAIRLYADGILSAEEAALIDSLSSKGLSYNSPAATELRRMLKEKGYDGIVYPNGYEGAGDSYIAFYPEQVVIFDDGKSNIKNSTNDRVAKVLIQSDYNKPSFKEIKNQSLSYIQRKIVDSGHEVEKIGKIAKDSTLYPAYNSAKQARQSAEYMIGEAQTDLYGNKVGESLKDIFSGIRAKGDDYFRDFSTYLFHMHNIDRMSLKDRYDIENKPVFGESIGANESIAAANDLLLKHPEFSELAKRVYKYNQNLMDYRVQAGLLSQKQANEMNEMYPHYVPTFRKTSGTSGSVAFGKSAKINQSVRKAKGSNLDLIPIDESMARQTMQTVQAGRRNVFGQLLLRDAMNHSDQLVDYIGTIKNDSDAKYDIDSEPSKQSLSNSFTIYVEGKPITMDLSDGVFEGIEAISSVPKEQSAVMSGIKSANDMYKRLITSLSPMFTIRNFARDIQDAGLYTKDLKGFVRNYPRAWSEMKNNGRLWQKYKALGGTGSSFFDYEKGIRLNDGNWFQKNVSDRIETINMMVEQAPRFAEFLSTVEKGGESYANLTQAMYDAADITTNFGRSGTWGRTLNTTFVPFFNPSIQGFDKMIRRFTQNPSAKDWTVLVIRLAAMGILPSVVNHLLLSDDEDYQKLTNRDKDLNYLFKVDDNLFVKIPKGRVLSLFGNVAQRGIRAVQGEEDPFAGFIETSIDQSAPTNPFTSNIVSPILGALSNRTWYGSQIENQSLEKYRPGERYDESTDVISKAIGSKTGLSPKKINYLLDSYSGVIGDFALPLLTPEAEQNPFVKAFVIDSTLSNRIMDDFYSTFDEITYDKNSEKPSPGIDSVYKYMNYQSGQTSELYKEIKKVENSRMPDREKREKTRELRDAINTIQSSALESLPVYQETAKRLSMFPSNEDPEVLYRNVNKSVFGPEYALKVYNKKVYEKAKEANKRLITYENFYNAYFAQKDVEGDGSPYSSSIRKKAAIDRNTVSLNKSQSQYLYKLFGVSENVW